MRTLQKIDDMIFTFNPIQNTKCNEQNIHFITSLINFTIRKTVYTRYEDFRFFPAIFRRV